MEAPIQCPVCHIGIMCEHDVGYDECDQCSFFAIYEDEGTWTREDIERIYRTIADEWKRMRGIE